MTRICIAAVFAFMVSFAVFSLPAAAADEPLEVRQLWLMFQDNGGKAGNDLLGKTVTVSGVVVETGMSVYLTPNVRLSDAQTGGVYVVCVLPRGDAGLLSGFAKGERVTMTGRVYRGDPNGGRVVLKECRRAAGQ